MWLLVLIILLVLTISCDDMADRYIDKPNDNQLSETQLDSILKYEELKKYDIYPEISYSKHKIENWRHFVEILKARNISIEKEKAKKILMTLNRKELRFFGKGDSIIVPDTIIEDIKAYSVFPQFYWAGRDIPKIIFITNQYQSYACYEFGRLVRFAAANTGKERTPSFPGRYALVWKIRNHRSSLDSNWVMPFTWNFHAEAGSAFHQFVMPGRPVSHSCIRQFLDDAEWLFYWGEGVKKDSAGMLIPLSGTPVVILDIFDFARPRYGPWLDLSSNKKVILELPDDPMSIEEALIPWCQIPDESKGNMRNRERYIYAEDTLRARGIIRPHVKLIASVNFNKLRRLKAQKEAQQKEAIQRVQQELESNERLLNTEQ